MGPFGLVSRTQTRKAQCQIPMGLDMVGILFQCPAEHLGRLALALLPEILECQVEQLLVLDVRSSSRPMLPCGAGDCKAQRRSVFPSKLEGPLERRNRIRRESDFNGARLARDAADESTFLQPDEH